MFILGNKSYSKKIKEDINVCRNMTCKKIWQSTLHLKGRSKTEGVSGEGNWITIWPKVHFQGLTCSRNFLLTWFRIFFRAPRGIPKSLRSLSWQRALRRTDVLPSQSHTYTGETPDLLRHLCACITSDSRSRLSFWKISRYCCRPSLVRVCSSVLQLSWYLSVGILQTGRKIMVLKITYQPRNIFSSALFAGKANVPLLLLNQSSDWSTGQTGWATLRKEARALMTSDMISFFLFGCVFGCITKAMPHYWNCPIKIWVSLLKEGMEPVDLRCYCVHYRLAVGGAVIEKQVQQCVVGEMS